MNHRSPHFLDKTWHKLRNVWSNVSANMQTRNSVLFEADLPDKDMSRLRDQMQSCLNTQNGEVLARIETAALGRAYLQLSALGRKRFLMVLATDFDVDINKLDVLIQQWSQSNNAADRYGNVQGLRQALRTPRMTLLTQFNELPEGVKFLVHMRAELLQFAKGDPALAALEADLKYLLVSWFDIGFLKLEHITWDTPASVLEKLIAYEAVHEIRSWDDLKNRLDSDRRCYAFFHPQMPGEPLIFVEVALTTGLATNVQTLLDKTAPIQDLQSVDTAIFYSISNAQLGLAGISFGNFLIKRVVANLSQEFSQLRHFSTLSPIVKFRSWLKEQVENEVSLLAASESKALTMLSEKLNVEVNLTHILESTDWAQDDEVSALLKPILTRLAAYYLQQKKYQTQFAFDPVAHFHLSNGACIEQINWLADQSEKGMQQSFGLMVNYLYKLDRIETNSMAYTTQGKVTNSHAVTALLKK